MCQTFSLKLATKKRNRKLFSFFCRFLFNTIKSQLVCRASKKKGNMKEKKKIACKEWEYKPTVYSQLKSFVDICGISMKHVRRNEKVSVISQTNTKCPMLNNTNTNTHTHLHWQTNDSWQYLLDILQTKIFYTHPCVDTNWSLDKQS